MYYGWSKEFLEAGKRRLAGGTAGLDSACVFRSQLTQKEPNGPDATLNVRRSQAHCGAQCV